MSKKRLQVNVSGGRTSAYMAWWLKENMSDEYDMIFIFSNTGKEHPDTYRFLEDVVKNFGIELVLVECVVHNGFRLSSTHTIHSFKTLSRSGEPFERVIKKYGISNVSFKHCNRELKFNPIKSYVKSIWPDGDYEIALGIRPDEARRVSKTAESQGIVYPLVDFHPQFPDYPDKEFILEWFSQFDWDLKIPEFLGNCVTCYKKSDKKLNMVWRDDPSHFDFFAKMEKLYGHIKPKTDPTPGNRKWWRGYRSTEQLLNFFRETDVDTSKYFSETDSGGCSESCEPYEMEEV